MAGEVPIVQRQAARALLLTPAAEILLMGVRLPGVTHPFWLAPGGGFEGDESAEQCLRRELQEEVGLEEFGELGQLVWMRQHTFDWNGRRGCQFERYFVIHVEKFEPHMSDPIESAVLDQFRWWPASELASAQERLTPLSLARIVASYLERGAPAEVDVEIVVDQ